MLLPSAFQSTVADVFHCLFHGSNDPNEPDRRQVGADPFTLFSINQQSEMSLSPSAVDAWMDKLNNLVFSVYIGLLETIILLPTPGFCPTTTEIFLFDFIANSIANGL